MLGCTSDAGCVRLHEQCKLLYGYGFLRYGCAPCGNRCLLSRAHSTNCVHVCVAGEMSDAGELLLVLYEHVRAAAPVRA